MERDIIPKNRKTAKPLRNESGFALIAVLAISAILMAFMSVVLNTSMVEIFMSGNARTGKQALSSADSGVEFTRGWLSTNPNFWTDNIAPGFTGAGNGDATLNPPSAPINFLAINGVTGIPANLSSVNISYRGIVNVPGNGYQDNYDPNGGGSLFPALAYRVDVVSVVAFSNKGIQGTVYRMVPGGGS